MLRRLFVFSLFCFGVLIGAASDGFGDLVALGLIGVSLRMSTLSRRYFAFVRRFALVAVWLCTAVTVALMVAAIVHMLQPTAWWVNAASWMLVAASVLPPVFHVVIRHVEARWSPPMQLRYGRIATVVGVLFVCAAVGSVVALLWATGLSDVSMDGSWLELVEGLVGGAVFGLFLPWAAIFLHLGRRLAAAGRATALDGPGPRYVITKSTMPAFSRPGDGARGDGIRANTISPGVVDTPMHASDDHEVLKKLHPIPRLVQVSEIVDALLYFESAPMVNSENIRIDRGAHAGAKC
jgi:NAD(P)-dependent dehydrogenase (short-subunit alcohol dehydrogenase family)